MHKGFDLINPDVEQWNLRVGESHPEIPFVKLKEGKKNIIFLDIDGVIQPYDNNYRFGHSPDLTMEKLRKEFDPKLVDEGDRWDILAAYYDWDEVALARVAKLCRHSGAYIVLHSSWIGSSSLERLKLFFEFHGMGDYVLDVCHKCDPEETGARERELGYWIGDKEAIILKWLDDHAGEVQNYIVIDDYDMSWTFGSRFIRTSDYMTDIDYQVARSALNRWMRYRQYDEETICIGETFIRYRIAEIGTVKMLFFTTEFTEHLMQKVSFDMWIKNIRILILILKGKYFSRERKEEYSDIDYLCWCWPTDSYYENRSDTLECVRIGYSDSRLSRNMSMQVLRAGRSKSERFFAEDSEENREACEIGEKLTENFGKHKIERDSSWY